MVFLTFQKQFKNTITNICILIYFNCKFVMSKTLKTNKMNVIWKKEYETGISKIDLQHRKIVSIINALNEEILVNKNYDVVNEILVDLKIYTITHLDYEERLFQKYKYEGEDFETHLKKHKDFKDTIAKLMGGVAIVKSELAYKISEFLKDWLIGHILDVDMKFAEFLKYKGVI